MAKRCVRNGGAMLSNSPHENGSSLTCPKVTVPNICGSGKIRSILQASIVPDQRNWRVVNTPGHPHISTNCHMGKGCALDHLFLLWYDLALLSLIAGRRRGVLRIFRRWICATTEGQISQVRPAKIDTTGRRRAREGVEKHCKNPLFQTPRRSQNRKIV